MAAGDTMLSDEEIEKRRQEEAERRVQTLYKVCRLYKEGEWDDVALLHFLAGFFGYTGNMSKF